MSDDPALRDRFIIRAKAQAERPEFERCIAVTQVICDALACGIRAEAEIFQAAYADPSGQEYWNAYLSEPILAVSLAYLLSAHGAENAGSLKYHKAAIIHAFRSAAGAGERWFTGDTGLLLPLEPGQVDFDELKVNVDPLAAIEWLLGKPRRRDLVPNSLRQHLHRLRTCETPAAPGRELASSSSPPGRGADSLERRRGPKPVVFERVRDRMLEDLRLGQCTTEGLESAKEIELESTYGASRDICRKARNRALSEFVRN